MLALQDMQQSGTLSDAQLETIVYANMRFQTSIEGGQTLIMKSPLLTLSDVSFLNTCIIWPIPDDRLIVQGLLLDSSLVMVQVRMAWQCTSHLRLPYLSSTGLLPDA